MTNRVYVMTFLIALVLAGLAQAQTFTLLYKFRGGTDGGYPYAGVIQDLSGNLYGTAASGGDLNCGTNGCGVVYKVNTTGTEKVLHSFGPVPDGQSPYTPVFRDHAGNMYGTTSGGGDYRYRGAGTVFKINTAGNETVLYSFTGGTDGCYPYQGLVVDKSGTMFGTTSYCGSSSGGTIFKLNSAGNFTLLHSFTAGGGGPYHGHLTMDKAGNLYGVTNGGGAHGYGMLYELSKGGTFTVLHSFTGGTTDGCDPLGSVTMDETGNFYGTTNGCGSYNYGTIWRVSSTGKESILHNFSGGTSGCDLVAGVARDSTGNLYGVTERCGAYSFGTLYELSAKGRFTLLHSFGGSRGAYPYGEVLRTTEGTLFGTTYSGGRANGTVWKYVPK